MIELFTPRSAAVAAAAIFSQRTAAVPGQLRRPVRSRISSIAEEAGATAGLGLLRIQHRDDYAVVKKKYSLAINELLTLHLKLAAGARQHEQPLLSR
jgi:hypothetical protein